MRVFLPAWRVLFVLATTLCSASTMAIVPTTQSGSFHLDATLTRVFPMFTANGERAWAPGWEPDFLSGETERGSVFRTRASSRTETVWIVTDYRLAEGRVSYARLAKGSTFGLVDIACSEARDGGTDVSVRYTLTGISTEGSAFVDQFLGAGHYQQMLEEWRSAIASALTAE